MTQNDELRDSFKHFDKDGDGRIDREEFSQLLDALGAGIAPEEVAIGFDLIDTDGNGTIDFDEFSGWWSDR